MAALRRVSTGLCLNSIKRRPAQWCLLAWCVALHMQCGSSAGAMPPPLRCLDVAAQETFHEWTVSSVPFGKAKGPRSRSWCCCQQRKFRSAWPRPGPIACALPSACRVSAFFAPARDHVAVEPLALVHMRPTQHPGGHAAALARLLFALKMGVQRLLRDQLPSVQPQERFSCLPYALWASLAPPALSGCAAPCTWPRRAWHTANYVSKAVLCVRPHPGHCSPGWLCRQVCLSRAMS